MLNSQNISDAKDLIINMEYDEETYFTEWIVFGLDELHELNIQKVLR